MYFLFRTPVVQTWAAQKITDYFSSEVNAIIRVGGVDIELFKKIVLEDVYIEDQHGDTLLLAPKIKLDISRFEYKKKNIIIKSILLDNTIAKIIRYKEEDDYNYQFLVDAFSSEDVDTSQSAPWDIKVTGLELVNVDFTYRDQHDTSQIDGINYWDLRTVNTNAIIENVYFVKDTTYAFIKHLSANEKSGFSLKSFSCYAAISPVSTKLDSLKIKTDKSDIATNLLLTYSTYNDYNDFIEKVTMNASFHRTVLNMYDISFFAPELKGTDNTLWLSGRIKGKVENLKGREMIIEFGRNSAFKGDFSFKGLPDINETFIVFDIDKFTTNKIDIESLPVPPFSEKQKIQLPPNTSLLGQMSFKGNFTGFLSDFVAYGTFNTAIGRIDSDLSMTSDTGITKKVKYKGKIKSYDFDIGKYLSLENYLGKVSIDAGIEGAGLKRDEIIAKLTGKVSSITFNSYTYQNIDVEGALSKKVFEGKLLVADPNLKLDFSGDVNFSGKLPHLNFIADMQNANLVALKLISDDSLSVLTSKMNINVTGNKIDNMLGNIKVYGVSYKDSRGIYNFNNVDLTISENAGIKNIKVISDFADLNVNGRYSVAELPSSLQDLIATYIPSFAKTGIEKKNKAHQQFTFSLLCKQTDSFMRLFLPGIEISQGATVSGEFDSENKRIKIDGQAEQLSVSGVNIVGWKLNVDKKGEELFIQTTGNYINLTDSLKVFAPVFYSITNSANSSITANIQWRQYSNQEHQSKMKFTTRFENINKTVTRVDSANIYLEDSLWVMQNGDNSIIQDSTAVKVGEVSFKSGKQEIKFYGSVSKDKSDKIYLSLSNFSLSNVNPFISSTGTQLKGVVSGSTFITDFYDKFLLSSNLSFSRLIVNNEFIGNGTINSKWDKENDGIAMDGVFARDSLNTNLRFKGNYYPSKKQNSLDFNIDLYSVKLQLFQEYVKDYCSVFAGQISGGITLKGTPAAPSLNGKLNVAAKKISVDYLNTSFGFNGDIFIEENSFGFRELEIRDEDTRKKAGAGIAVVSGKLYHDNFKDFQLDFDIRANNFQFLNTNEKLNELYYGKVNASGIANFFGYLNNIVIDANLKTEKGTQINIPLSSTEEVNETSFITFIKKGKDTAAVAKKHKVDLKGMRLNFDLEVTPAAEVQLIFDSKIGDIIRGSGNGNIKMAISTLGDFSMFGDFTITEGDYLFTLKNVINKRFDIESGGTIEWTGDPYKATVNITAVYRQRASIHPFFPTDSSAVYKKRYTVDCKLKMTDDLMSPNITFDIDLPTVDENTRQQIKSYINTEQEMNRQVFSLLILKSFVTPPQLIGIGTPESGVGGAGVATSAELLSNQLSNWLSQISNDFDIGVNYRPGDNLSSDELEVALSKQVFNDKVTIDGNLGVTNNSNATQQQNASNIAGDVNIEYKITDDGKLRVRGFNKANDNTLLSSATAPYTQGVGIFYREEFNTLGELYQRYLDKLSSGKKKGNSQ